MMNTVDSEYSTVEQNCYYNYIVTLGHYGRWSDRSMMNTVDSEYSTVEQNCYYNCIVILGHSGNNADIFGILESTVIL